jgi:RNA polymerase sigma-70 factor (ECF subfamily)
MAALEFLAVVLSSVSVTKSILSCRPIMNSGQYEDCARHPSSDQLDQKLVSRVQKGDRSAFDLLVVKYQNKVASIISRYVDDLSEIADITQEVFIKAYRGIQNFRGDSAFYTWLFRITLNTAKNYLLKNRKQPGQTSVEDQDTQDLITESWKSLDTPDRLIGRSELAEGIQNALSVMPEELSVALILREFEGLSYEEISKVMECPVGTVRSRIFRARELLDNTIKSLTDIQ